jgi:CHAT domain-containing protein
MISKYNISVLTLLFSILFTSASLSQGRTTPVTYTGNKMADTIEIRLAQLTGDLREVVEKGTGIIEDGKMASAIEQLIAGNKTYDTLLLSDSYYFLGHYYLRNNRYYQAIEYFTISERYRETVGMYDRRHALCLSNIAVALFKAGDYSHAYTEGIRALAARRLVTGSDSSSLASIYLNLSSICLEMNDSENAITFAEAGLRLSTIYAEKVLPRVTADLYQVIGLSLYRNSEYTKSLVYCREALKLYDCNGAVSSASKQLILNTMAQVFRRLGQSAEAERYYKRGLAVTGDENVEEKYLLYINYAGFLAESGRKEEGEKVLEGGIEAVKQTFGSDSREYCMMQAARADFAHKIPDGGARALDIYRNCFSYIVNHPWDLSMRKYLLTDYAETLYDVGYYNEVMEVVDTLLQTPEKRSASTSSSADEDIYTGDDLEVLLLRYRSLNAVASETGDSDYLRQAVETGRIIVSLYDRQRLEMSEEESRNSLSADSRDFYTAIIDDYVQLYNQHHDRAYLDGAFEFSERSKVAGFLASMREVNAAKLSLPDEMVTLDNEIRGRIGLYRELVTNEKKKAVPDSQRIATWESVTFSLLRSRDSLIQIFEKNYPSYYTLKFKSSVTPLEDVPDIISKKANLLSYVLTDSKLYIFITNRHHTEIITRNIDSTFYSSLNRFRKMLSVMPETSNVRKPFNDFMDLAYELYHILLEPAVPYLRGDKIIISPDNILSYLPFETLVTDQFRSPDLLYREAPFALKKYRFSYIYSVTLSSETHERSRSLNNQLIAFAPSYDGMEISDSLYNIYPNLRGRIRSLPYAAVESEDAVRQCGGMAFIGENATEEAYKREAGKYAIIHLAMHTLLDDNHPAFSKMIFSASKEGKEDGLLNTYEVYCIQVNAMMVVLSSCNTGTGMMVTGEGILSLARGFLFAGSRSVVMSMWAVEDFSASAVVKAFYKNMRSGQTKSTALRNARLSFLRSADQARSHPYYWSALVIYGDDTPLWFNRVRLYSSLLLFLLAAAVLIAIVYKGPRS